MALKQRMSARKTQFGRAYDSRKQFLRLQLSSIGMTHVRFIDNNFQLKKFQIDIDIHLIIFPSIAFIRVARTSELTQPSIAFLYDMAPDVAVVSALSSSSSFPSHCTLWRFSLSPLVVNRIICARAMQCRSLTKLIVISYAHFCRQKNEISVLNFSIVRRNASKRKTDPYNVYSGCSTFHRYRFAF